MLGTSVTGLVLVVCLQTVLAYPNSDYTCSLSKVTSCMSDLKHFISENDLDKVIKVDDEQELDTLCRDYEETKFCMEPFVDNCDEIARATWDGVSDGYEWLCSEGRAEFLRNNPCVLRHEYIIKQRTTRCTNEYQNKVTIQDKDEVCSATDEFVSCLSKAVGNSCGEEAGDWLKEYNTRVLSPLFKKLGCKNEQPSTTANEQQVNLALILGIAIPAGVLLVIGLISICVCCCRNKSSTPQFAPQPSRVLHPPASSGYKNFVDDYPSVHAN